MEGNGMCMLAEVDQILNRHGTGPENTIGILQDIQNHFRYLPMEALDHVCEKTEISPSQIFGVATFYAQFRLDPVGEHIIRVCHGTACHVIGAKNLTEALEGHLGVRDGGNTADMKYTLESVACLGCCSLAPVIMIDDETHANLDRSSVVKVVQEHQDAHSDVH
jgi:NADH:ubiquinone oxidoreductase subunit E